MNIAQQHDPRSVRWLRPLLALSLIWTVACSSAGAWDYASKVTTPAAESRAGGRIAVLPFEDRRGSRNRDRTLLALIPLVPYAGMRIERMEGGARFLTHSAYQIRPAEDLAKALLSELKAVHKFDEAFFTEREQQPGVDFIVRGFVSTFEYRGKLFTYGLGAYGSTLWLLGLPFGQSSNHLEVGVELVDAHTGTVIWKSDPAPSDWSQRSGYYYNWGKEFAGFPELYRKHAERWAKELAQAVERARGAAPAVATEAGEPTSGG